MPSAMMQIHGLVKKSGDRIAVHGVSFSVLERKSSACWGPRWRHVPGPSQNFTQILHKPSLSLMTFPPSLPYSCREDNAARATREGAYEADIRTAIIPVSALGLVVSFAPRPMW